MGYLLQSAYLGNLTSRVYPFEFTIFGEMCWSRCWDFIVRAGILGLRNFASAIAVPHSRCHHPTLLRPAKSSAICAQQQLLQAFFGNGRHDTDDRMAVLATFTKRVITITITKANMRAKAVMVSIGCSIKAAANFCFPEGAAQQLTDLPCIKLC